MGQRLVPAKGTVDTNDHSSSLSALENSYLGALQELREAAPHVLPDWPILGKRSPVGIGEISRSLLSRHVPRLEKVLAFQPEVVKRTTRTRIVRRWTAVVEDINEDVFTARLTPTRGGSGDDLIADFSVEEVSDEDLPLLAPGAWFYVNVSKQTFSDGRQQTITSLRFRRLKKWSEDELEVAGERGKKRFELLSEE